MPEDQDDQSKDSGFPAGYSSPVEQLTGYSLHEPDPSFWLNVVLGISLFGALWPFARFLLNLLEPAGSSSLWLLPVHEMLFAGVISLLFGGTICIVALAVLSAGVAMGMNLVLKTMSVASEQLIVGTATGGIAGLLLSLPFCFVDDPSYLKCTVLICTATLFSQSGGTWGAWRVLYGSKSASTVAAELSKGMRFGVRHLLLLSVWCAVVLTTLKYLRVLNERLLGMVGIWFVVQVVFVVALLGWIRWHEQSRLASQEDGV